MSATVSAQLADAASKQAERFDQGIAASVADAGRNGADMVVNSLESCASETDKAFLNLKSVPGTVTTECARFLDPVGHSYQDAIGDLTEALNTFDTHASSFDAHPNEAAHRVIAEQIYRALVAH